ncbi:MAG: phosphoribosylaminoimidazolesuccinocarboxamide synthase [Candidatus Thermoplasmatota archaeon]|nr:phosphoribosylaminoimidazolesuccinocarboxamide synthase [Candidatus Thermoplasmatota archaeon]
MRLIMKGKVKEVYETENENELEFFFTNHISVFDKVIPSEIEYKGETLCRTSSYWFSVAENIGIKTHFIKTTGPDRMRVKKVDVIRDYSKLNEKTTNYLIPLEFICRYYVAGSLFDRIKNKEIKNETLGFDPDYNVKYGDKLTTPFFEVTTKLEKTDRNLNLDEALKISGISEDEYKSIKEMFLRIDEKMNNDVGRRGLIHVDGKKEFAFDENRDIMLIDTFGTADEDRFWDADKYEKGEFVELSKECVRQYYREINYHEKLASARKNGLTEPDIPPLPDDQIQKTSELYIKLFEKITGEKFR